MNNFFDVIDVTSSDLEVLYTRLVALGTTTILRYESMSNAVAQMGSDVLAKAGPRGAYVVRVWGHGLPGVVPIAAGLKPEDVRDHRAGLLVRKDLDTNTYNNNVDLANLGPLKAAMNPAGRLEFHGCSIALGKIGEQFGCAVAKLMGCWVYASESCQFGLEWVPPVVGFPPGGGPPVRNAPPPPLKW